MNSLEYWRQREDEARQKNKKTEEQLKKETGERIEYMLNQMNKEIARFYSKYANDEDISISEAKKRVTQLDIDEYARKAKKYVKEKDFSDEANAEMKLYNLTMKINRLELLKANLGLETVDCFNDLQKYYEDALTEESLKEFQRMSGILGKTVLNNGQQARELANTSFQNATFSQRIWGHSAIFRDEVSKLLTQGLTAGINSMELARRLRKTVDSTKHQAETLMVTEMSRVRSGAQLISIEENGYDSYVFVSDPIEGAGHACHVCKSLDGKIFSVKEGKAGENMPPMHPWCRCSIAASFSEDDDALYDEWLDGYKGHGLTFEEWIQKESKVVKEEGLRTDETQDYHVNWNVVKSKEYTELFNKFSDNPKANELLAQCARKALVRRDKKGTEEIYAISLTSGKMISSITNQHYFKKVIRTAKFERDVNRFVERGEKIAFIHNHPSSTMPSVADINLLLETPNSFGLIAGHEGNVYKYTKPNRKIEEDDFRIALSDYVMYSKRTMNEKAMMKLARQFEFEIEEVKVIK